MPAVRNMPGEASRATCTFGKSWRTMTSFTDRAAAAALSAPSTRSRNVLPFSYGSACSASVPDGGATRFVLCGPGRDRRDDHCSYLHRAGIRRIIVPSENAQRRRSLHRAVLDRCPPHTYKRFRRAWRKRLEPQRGDGSIRNRRESRAEGPAFSCTYNETLGRKAKK